VLGVDMKLYALKRYKLYKKALSILNEGIEKSIQYIDGYVWDTITNRMDSIWDELTEEEKNELKKKED
jgi:hypothetical protein